MQNINNGGVLNMKMNKQFVIPEILEGLSGIILAQ